MPNGILLVDKPDGMTSHGVVSRVRRLAGTKKVGHAGTLDPMATGLLILGLGPSTRLLTWLVGADKEYLATIRLGSTTVTDDAEGDVIDSAAPGLVAAVTTERIVEGVSVLTGDIEQVPSAVSAIKVDGVRSYAKVRAGEDVALAARPVTVSAFEILAERRGDESIDLDVRVVCSSGTYIRALARDLGSALGIGGHLTALRRTRIGAFDVTEALTLDALAERGEDTAATVEEVLLRPAAAAARFLPVIALDDQQATDLGHGKIVSIAQKADTTDSTDTTDITDSTDSRETLEAVAAVAAGDRLVGIARLDAGALRTLVNFPEDVVP
jgi:tRNA pseudouridine55 synthase